MELIDIAEIKRIWSLRWAIVTAAQVAAAGAYMMLPTDWQAAIPNWVKFTLAATTLGTAIATGVSRVIKQPVK